MFEKKILLDTLKMSDVVYMNGFDNFEIFDASSQEEVRGVYFFLFKKTPWWRKGKVKKLVDRIRKEFNQFAIKPAEFYISFD